MRFLLLIFFLATTAFAETPGKLTLVIHHTYNGEPLEFDRVGLTTTAGEKISVSRLAYLLAEPALQPAQKEEWLTSRDWFGFADAARGNAVQVLSGLPRKTFTSLRFHLGPDAETDGKNPDSYAADHPLNPLVNNLHWGWAGGFVYLALEGSSTASGYSFHLAGAANRAEVTLLVVLDLSRDLTIEVEFHVDQLFGDVVLSEVNSTHSRMGDEQAARLRRQIEGAFTVRSVYETKAIALPSTARAATSLAGTPYRFTIPKGVPIPPLPTDFPLTNERVELGRKLFHETRLSRDGSQSCSSCHEAAAAFGDRRRVSVGVDGRAGERNGMPLFNLAWKKDFFWDGRSPSLRAQALEPIRNPVEMHAELAEVSHRLTSDPGYARDFAKAFDSPEISATRIGLALEAFVMTLTSFDSRFDRALRGEAQLSEQEKRGFQLFVTEYEPRLNQFGADCFHCHGGPLFTDHQFHNNGLAIDQADPGRQRVTGRAEDAGKFSTPSLRNVKLTAPYMHDGRFKTLAEVVDHYDHGMARAATLDPNLGKHPREGLRLTSEDKAALVAFLETLTDEQLAAQ